MESSMVIKVKYGDTLRRFSVSVGDNRQLDLDMNGLRARVLGLFNFPPDADITLRYVDEDGDMVTLVEDEDLLDAMRQRLKFLKIDVSLSNEKDGEYARSSENSTPLRSPRVQYPLSNIDATVTEALKSVPVPEPLKEAISKLSVNLASKATTSSPVLGELVEMFSKLGQSYITPGFGSQSGVNATAENVSSEIPVVPAVSGGLNMSKDTSKLDNVFKSYLDSISKSGVTKDVRSSTVPVVPTVDLNHDPPADSVPFGAIPSGFFDVSSAKHKKETKNSEDSRVHHKFHGLATSSSFAGPNCYSAPMSNQTTGFGGGPIKQCPFRGTPVSDTPLAYDYLSHDSTVPPVHRHTDPFNNSFTLRDAIGGMFHKGVRCDICGVHPITGPRFKSKVKDDYDLCSICFAESGNEIDYIRMDRPVSYRHPRVLKGLYGHNQNGWAGHPPPTTPPQTAFRSHGLKSVRPKLDSRFVSDITVVDGTMMAPSTRFPKIWRMRNNGNFVWPRGTHLLWIGGDRFTNADSVGLEIPENGVPIDGQLDVAVDFTAPELPGRYISYWRMASSSGHKFGQRVWALIQVNASMEDSTSDSLCDLNLNLPPDCAVPKGPEMIDINVKPTTEDDMFVSANSNNVTDTVNHAGIELPKQDRDQDLNFPINDALLVGQSAPASAPPASPSLSYPIINISEAINGPSFAPYPVVETSAVKVNEETEDVEQALLKELEEMGFKQVDLNKEVLRLNEYDLEQSVNDLCGGVAGWDPMLEELEEMGFGDTELNRRLLVKNNGSIKRVVMDLISGQKA